MNKEIAWFLCPILSLLRQLDGTWGTPWQFGGIFAVALFLQLFGKLRQWRGIATLVLFYILGTLPVTLGGDSVTATWYSWLWIWVLGFIQGLWYLLYNKKTALYALFPMVLYGLFITLSNISATANFFPWKLCEGVMGFAIGIPFAFCIGSED